MEYKISQEQLEQFSRIYNTFLELTVQGESAFIYVDAMRAFKQVVQAVSNTPIENERKE